MVVSVLLWWLVLQMMVGPAIFSAIDFLMQLPMFAKYRPQPSPRQCVQRYYERVHPARLSEIDLDELVGRYKGRETQLYRKLESKYRRPFKCE